MESKTPLYDIHVELGGKIVEFAGYFLPIQYSSVIEEHMVVREKAGLFDVSHMGEVVLSGSDALNSLNHLCSNDFTNLTPGRASYTTMLNTKGGVIDDFLVYCLSKNHYWLVVNAANRTKDLDWIKKNVIGDTVVQDISDSIGQLALQGPKSLEIISKLASDENIPKRYFSFVEGADIGGVSCLISRTGYTGSFGYEIYCEAEDTPVLWKNIMDMGQEFGIMPCGLAARDTLRLEASLPLYGHEMTEEISPLETSLDFAVKMGKADFIGKEALVNNGTPAITRVGLKVTGKGIARENCEVFAGDNRVGTVTSGTHLPYMKGAYAMALLDKNHSAIGNSVIIDIRGRKVEAEIVPMPFYQL